MQEAILIAGANGAGKTTFARQVLPALYPDVSFLNVDEIQSENPALAHPVAAGRELLRRLGEREESGESFAIETTLSSRMYARRIVLWRSSGYRVDLHFIELPSEDLAIRRVSLRVAAGGRSVPEPDVRRADSIGVSCCSISSTSRSSTSGIIGSATMEGFALSSTRRDERQVAKIEILLEAARRANWDALHGPIHLRAGRFRLSSWASDRSDRGWAAEQADASDAAPRRH